ncbi:MAG: hypothetical protein EBU08_10930 [Micrococcales bacterium]|nr:hypothetical protein [Micrococcales bacterium]
MKLKIIAASLLLAFGSAQSQTQNAETQELKFLQQGGVTAAWARGITGRGVTIGIIDNGFDLTHTDLKGQVVGAINLQGGAVTWGSHGTQMASIAAGVRDNSGTVGVAPGARLLLAQVGPGGTNLALSQTNIAQALDWLSQKGAAVINMSFGGKYSSTFTSGVRYDPVSRAYIGSPLFGSTSEYQLATSRGSILVFSAGNQGLPYVQQPAIYAVQTTSTGHLVLGGRALVVGSVDASNMIASYSNRAGHICQNVVAGSCRDTVQTMNYFVVAPGTAIQAATPNAMVKTNTAGSVSGTSASAAYVSGGMALIKQAWPTLKPEQLVNIVLITARDLGAPGVDTTYGRGLVDFNRATNPIGQLRIAAASYRLDQSGMIGSNANLTGIGGSIAVAFKSSTVLSQVQVIDDMGRNYAADFTRSMAVRQQTYDPVNPYLGFAGYTPLSAKFGSYDLTAYAGSSGSAIELAKEFGPLKLSYQTGMMQERNGFLGNYGSGGLDLGNSQTNWQTIGSEFKIANNTSVQARYSLGRTNVANAGTSMIQTLGPVTTDTWQLGLVRKDQFREADTISFGLAGDIRVRQGRALITAVTGYEYDEIDGEVQARPIVSRETVNLRQSAQPVLWANYLTPVGVNSLVRLGVSAGQAGYRAGVMFTWIQ